MTAMARNVQVCTVSSFVAQVVRCPDEALPAIACEGLMQDMAVISKSKMRGIVSIVVSTTSTPFFRVWFLVPGWTFKDWVSRVRGGCLLLGYQVRSSSLDLTQPGTWKCVNLVGMKRDEARTPSGIVPQSSPSSLNSFR